MKSYTMLGLLADDPKAIRPHSGKHRYLHLEEIVSNFEITNKRFFSIAVLKFKPDRCCLSDKSCKGLMFINCNKHFKHLLFMSL